MKENNKKMLQKLEKVARMRVEQEESKRISSSQIRIRIVFLLGNILLLWFDSKYTTILYKFQGIRLKNDSRSAQDAA